VARGCERDVAGGPGGHSCGVSKPDRQADRRSLAAAALICCACLWSLNGPLIKLLYAEAVSGWTIACYRSLIGGLLFLPWAWPRRGSLAAAGCFWPVFSVLAFTFMTASFCIATTMTAASSAIILQYTSPIWVFLLSPLLLHEKPGAAEGLVLLVAMTGVGIIFAGQHQTDAAGLAVALCSGLGYGALTVALRGLRAVNPLVVAALNALSSGVLLLLPVALWGGFGLAPRAWLLVFVLSLVQFTLPYVLFSWALQRIEAHKAALIVLLETVLNPVWTFLLVGERVPLPTLRGGPLILVGVAGWLLLSWHRQRRMAR
jgi:DME family drug/metabolite transporter